MIPGELAAVCTAVIVLIAAAVTDIKSRIIPNKIVYAGIGLLVVLRLLFHPLPLWHYVTGFALGGGVLYGLAALSRGGMGGGDIKLMAFTGLALGWKLTLVALFLSSLTGIVIAVLLIALNRWKRNAALPYAPFIALGTLCAYYWGESLLTRYISFLYG